MDPSAALRTPATQALADFADFADLSSLESGSGKRECRICLDSGDQKTLIAPCLCAGTSKWVHRGCLDRWRAIKQNPRAFTHCSECGFEYQLKLERIEEKQNCCINRKSKFRLMVARDVVTVFLLVQLAVLACALVVYSCDPSRRLNKLYNEKTGDWGWQEHSGFCRVYYVAGALLLLLIIGLCVVLEMCGCCEGQCSGTCNGGQCDCW